MIFKMKTFLAFVHKMQTRQQIQKGEGETFKKMQIYRMMEKMVQAEA